MLDRRFPWLVAAVLATATLAAALALADGGAPPARPQPGVTVWRPILESWTLVHSGPQVPEEPLRGGMLCSDARPCDWDTLVGASEEGACTLTARAWLANTWRGWPVLRDVEASVYVVASRGTWEPGEGGVLNGSLWLSEFPLRGEKPTWWKMEERRVVVSTPVPCDSSGVRVTVQYHGTTPRGERVPYPQTFEVPVRT